MSSQEEIPGQTQDMLERLYFFSGLETPRHPPEGAEGIGWGEDVLHLPTETAVPLTLYMYVDPAHPHLVEMKEY